MDQDQREQRRRKQEREKKEKEKEKEKEREKSSLSKPRQGVESISTEPASASMSKKGAAEVGVDVK